MPEFAAWGFDEITTTGPNPFASDNFGNASSVGVSTFTINPGTTPQLIQMTDNDSIYQDADSGQRFTSAITINGINFRIGDEIETEYSYVVRDTASSDPADNITIYVLDLEGDAEGFTSDGQLQAGTTYRIIAIDSNNPSIPYSSLFVCFASGTRIATPAGERLVEMLAPGDLVLAVDHEAEPLRWVGQRTLTFPPGPAAQKPVLLPRGSLGNGLPHRDLVVSPQHRMLLAGRMVSAAFDAPEVLALAKSLTPLPGVRQMNGRRTVTYHTLLFDRHEVVLAEGAAAESLYPGPQALRMLGPELRAEVIELFPALRDNPETGFGPRARPITTCRETRTFLRRLKKTAPPGATTVSRARAAAPAWPGTGRPGLPAGRAASPAGYRPHASAR